MIKFIGVNNNYSAIMRNFVQKRSSKTQIITTTQLIASSGEIRQTISISPPSSPRSPYLFSAIKNVFRNRQRYPFQLLKQFYLFPEDISSDLSLSLEYTHLPYDGEWGIQNIIGVCVRARQKSLLEGFTEIKNWMHFRQRKDAAYRCEDNVNLLCNKISSLLFRENIEVVENVFLQLYENYKVSKLAKLNLSKIQPKKQISVGSKELDDEIGHFLKKEQEIQMINSYYLQHNSEEDDHQRSKRQQQEEEDDHFEVQIRYAKRQNQNNGMQLEQDERNTQKKKTRSELMQTPKTKLKPEEKLYKETLQRRRKLVDTSPRYKQQPQTNITASPSQQIYIIRPNSVSHKTKPSNYIKIPVTSTNINIIELQQEVKTDRKQKKYAFKSKRESVELIDIDCSNCKYCVWMREINEKKKTWGVGLMDIRNGNQSQQTNK